MTFLEFMRENYPRVRPCSGWEFNMAQRVWLAALQEGAKGASLACPVCNGQGYLLDYDRGMDSYEKETCHKCKGSGTKS